MRLDMLAERDLFLQLAILQKQLASTALFSWTMAGHGFEIVRPNVRVNRHVAAGRVWARIFEPKLGPPQSVRLNDQLGSTAPALNEPTVRCEGDLIITTEIFDAHDF